MAGPGIIIGLDYAAAYAHAAALGADLTLMAAVLPAAERALLAHLRRS
ncbi:DUF7697 family protein [Prosthecomicrobium hirschii]|nr:hypothetical protein [Prosthecomicrobium hirschii]MCW1839439.1 hypothetical protein [Prosthecomicrobium hirschii]